MRLMQSFNFLLMVIIKYYGIPVRIFNTKLAPCHLLMESIIVWFSPALIDYVGIG